MFQILYVSFETGLCVNVKFVPIVNQRIRSIRKRQFNLFSHSESVSTVGGSQWLKICCKHSTLQSGG